MILTASTFEIRTAGGGNSAVLGSLSPLAVPLLLKPRYSAWLDVRGRHPGPIWTGQRGPLTISGITQVVLATGDDADIPGLRSHRARHTFATRLRQGGADPAQVTGLAWTFLNRHRSQVLQSRVSREGRSHRTSLQRLTGR